MDSAVAVQTNGVDVRLYLVTNVSDFGSVGGNGRSGADQLSAAFDSRITNG